MIDREKEAELVLNTAKEKYGEKLVLASSMGAEDQVLVDMIHRLNLNISVFTIDTGRLFSETYQLISETVERYDLELKVFFPDYKEVEELVGNYGINLFYKSAELRHKCCRVRKLSPLKRALKPYDAWICGLRREQSAMRSGIEVFMEDKLNDKVKISPLLEWSEEEIYEYIRKYNVPYNKLHDVGYRSIGCSCCTRAIKKTDDIRSGRWWWESEGLKECGLHWDNGKLTRINKELKEEK